jgi:hypothetical protein
VTNCCNCWWSTPNRAAIGRIDLRLPSNINPRRYNQGGHVTVSAGDSGPPSPAPSAFHPNRSSWIIDCFGLVPVTELLLAHHGREPNSNITAPAGITSCANEQRRRVRKSPALVPEYDDGPTRPPHASSG